MTMWKVFFLSIVIIKYFVVNILTCTFQMWNWNICPNVNVLIHLCQTDWYFFHRIQRAAVKNWGCCRERTWSSVLWFGSWMKRINSWQQEMQNWYAWNNSLKHVWSCVKDLLWVTCLLTSRNYKPCNLSIKTPFIRFVINNYFRLHS